MPLQHLRSSTAHKRPIPTVMSAGQIAVNTNEASPGLFFKDSNGDLVKVGPVHIGTAAPNSSPASVAATALVAGTVYQILTAGTSDFTLVGASANTVGTIFTATGTTTGTGTVSGQQGVEKGEMWLDTEGGTYVLKVYDGSAWRSESDTFVDVSGDTMTGDLVMNNANIVFEGATADDFETTLTVTDPTADRTITLPNVTGTVVTTGDTGTVTSTMISDGTIVNADVNGSAAIAGTKIDPDFGSQTVETTGVFSAAGGAAATPSIAFTGDLNTGIYSPGADQVAVATGGTGRLFVDSSGNVGVLKSSPNAPLDINLAADRGIQATASASSPSFIRSYQGEVSNKIRDIGLQGYTIRFETGLNTGSTTTESARIDSAGRLLVGTSTSVATSVGQPPIQVTTGQSIIRYSSTGSFPAVLDICHSKSNTIGTNTSLGDGDAIGRISYGGADGSSYVTAARVEAFVDGTPGTNDMPGRLVFSTTADGASSPTERMRITSQGRADNFGATEVLRVRTADTTASASITIRLQAGVTNINTGGTTEFQVKSNGNVENTNNAYGAISDVKLKENIVDANSQWDDLKALQVRNYNFKEGQTHTQIGLVAQEVELVSPGLVSESPDLDEDGNDLGTVTKSVNYSVLYMKAVKALQEAMERIETLEAEVAALKAS